MRAYHYPSYLYTLQSFPPSLPPDLLPFPSQGLPLCTRSPPVEEAAGG